MSLLLLDNPLILDKNELLLAEDDVLRTQNQPVLVENQLLIDENGLLRVKNQLLIEENELPRVSITYVRSGTDRFRRHLSFAFREDRALLVRNALLPDDDAFLLLVARPSPLHAYLT